VFSGGGFTQIGRQFIASGSVTIWSFSIAFLLGWIIKKTMGFRTTTDVEVEGIDVGEHAESAYDFAPSGGGGSSNGAFALAGIAPGSGTPAEAPVSEKVAG
jgi:Amt family ammonium transporter